MLKRSRLPVLLALFACADLMAAPTAVAPAETEAVSYEDAWTAILQQTVTSDGLVRYGQIGGPLAAQFEEVVAAVEAFDAGALSTDAEKLAFWMNAYNVKLIERVLEAGTPANIEAHGFDFFFKTPITVAGTEVTLDQIENVILRRGDGPAALTAFYPARLDPRLHVGLNCGAISCPRLRQTAFTASNVDAELDRAMRDFANGTQHFRVDGETVVVSSLLDWFAADWDMAGEPAGDYLLGYLDPSRPGADRLRSLFEGRAAAEIKAQPGVQFEYLWTLNAAG
ncbi:MAG: DUF547 domain-containing protein [Bacteroidota bacterium]